MNKKKTEQIRNFFQIVSKMQPDFSKEIGLIIADKETLADISAAAPMPNSVMSLDLNKDKDSQEIIEYLFQGLADKMTVVIQLHDWLDPKIYNQLYLISKEGRMQFARPDDWANLNIPKEANLVLISTDKDLEKLNYKNIFDLVGPVLRLE